MDVPTLVCGCGMRIKAPGAKPGRVGRCPSCGGRLEVPQAPPIPDEPAAEIGLADPEDGFGPHREIVLTPARTSESKPKGKRKRPREIVGPKGGRPPMADGFLPVLQKPETSWLTSFFYPLRGAESMGVVAAIGFIAWIFLTLVPEYCLQAMADTESMGAGLIGMLFVWLAVIPILFLGPPVLFYWLQYLGRILVSSATGDCAPPRTPDRNFDGFLNGLSPWFIWLVLGLGLGSMPALWLAFPDGRFAGGVPWTSLMLALAALPYILAALMLSFLHDDSMAAMPWGVLLGLVRLGRLVPDPRRPGRRRARIRRRLLRPGTGAAPVRLLALPAGLPRLLGHLPLDPDGDHAAARHVLLPPQGYAAMAQGPSAMGSQVASVRDVRSQ